MTTTTVKTIGAAGDYTTVALWFAACPADLVSTDQIWRGEVLNEEVVAVATIAGITTDATRYVELTAQAGASFIDNAGAATNPLRYDSTKGAALTNATYRSVGLSFANDVYAKFSRLQIRGTHWRGTAFYGGAHTDVNQCIIDDASENSGSATIRNSLIINRGAGYIFYIPRGGRATNCTFVMANSGSRGVVTGHGHGNVTLKNCYVGGTLSEYLVVGPGGSGVFTITNCATSFAGPPAGWLAAAYSTATFESVTAGSLDLRVKSGSALIDAGTTDATYAPNDIIGTARPSGSAYDIGAWEYVAAGGGGSSSDLTIQDATHAHSSDSPVLVTQSTLVVADASHAHAADSLTLTTLSVLSIADSSHGHAADNLTLAGSSAADLVIQDSTHAHAADSLTLATQSTLVVADASHGHAADSLNLAAQSFLAIADATHGHATDNLTLSAGLVVDLTIQEASHGHAADNVALAVQSFLSILGASHGHTADSLTLTTLSVLSIADSSHGHAADNLTLSPVLVVDLTIQDSTHAHTSDTPALTNIPPTSKPGYIADDTYRSFSSDDPLRVFATDDLAGGMHMAHRFPSIEVEEKVPLTFRFGAELVDQGATLASISSVAVAVRNGVADASPSSLVTTFIISGTNVVAAVDGRTAGADFELRVTCATSNPYLVLTRVGYLQVNG